MAALPNWKPQGYHKLSRMQGQYPEYAILRRFGSLSMMSLLDHQAQLVVLEKELWALCARDEEMQKNLTDKEKYSTYFVKLHEDQKGSNDQLRKLEEIRTKVKEYYSELLQAAAVAALPQPKNHQIRTLRDWLEGEQEGNNFLSLEERHTWTPKQNTADFITADLVTFLPATGWMNPQLFDFFHWVRGVSFSRFINRLLCRYPKSRKKTGKTTESHDLEFGRIKDLDSTPFMKTFKILWTFAITIFASLLPVLAILALYFVKETLYRIAVTIGFTAFFGIVLIIFTSIELKEVFAATAAFAAVEVVFIGSANGT